MDKNTSQKVETTIIFMENFKDYVNIFFSFLRKKNKKKAHDWFRLPKIQRSSLKDKTKVSQTTSVNGKSTKKVHWQTSENIMETD